MRYFIQSVRVLIVVWSLLSSTYVFAQEAELREIVVTASKTEEDIKDVPASVEVITRQQLEARGAIKLNDILRLATGVYQYTGLTRDNSAVSIRGFDNKQSLILIDGRRLSGEPTGVFEIDRITVEDIERIEIVRGPVSALYGSDALGGVINIITRTSEKPFFQFHPQFGTYRGDGNRTTISGIAGSGDLGRFNVILSGLYQRQKPLIVNNDTTLDDGDLKRVSMKTHYSFSKSTKLMFDGSYTKELVRLQTETMGQINSSRYDNYRYDLSLALDHRSDLVDLFVRGYTSVYNKDYEQRNKKTGALTDFYPAERKTPTVEIRATKELLKGHVTTLGAEYRSDYYRGAKVTTGEGTYSETREGLTRSGSEKTIGYWAVYLQDEWIIDNSLILVPALRYDDSDKFSSNISPRLGVTYKVYPNLRLKANIGQAFRSPNVEELYQFFTTRMARFWNSVRGNPNLKPEKSTSYELALEAETGKFRGRTALFYNDVKDLIKNVLTGGKGTATDPQVFVSQNISKARIQGFEIESGVEITKGLDLRASYTYLDAKSKTDDKPLTLRPKHKLVAQGSYQYKPWDVRLDLWTEYIADYVMSDYEEKSYNTWHFNISKDINKNFNLCVGIDNIFNKKDSEIPLNGVFYYAGLRARF